MNVAELGDSGGSKDCGSCKTVVEGLVVEAEEACVPDVDEEEEEGEVVEVVVVEEDDEDFDSANLGFDSDLWPRDLRGRPTSSNTSFTSHP